MRTCRKKNALIVTQINDNDFISTENLEKKIINRKVSSLVKKSIGYKQDK